MTLDELKEYILGQYEAESDHSFEEDSSVIVFKRQDNKKWFAAAKNIGCRSVNVSRAGRIDILNVRLSPRDITALRSREGFRPAWRMNANSSQLAGQGLHACRSQGKKAVSRTLV